ncbi:hypothetical protein JANAI62_26870 [Jannaschia pagri]|uniref:TIGR00255 family protein n=2 Tax=Roseobacteraceae TaxID=2854170 RepID=A0ABQ4NNT5_9RHOB|nr:hypothetical protein JANAI61_26880 [Jannaschia sp. AI_61]GIT96064.1 hypothetical protein JANAI62_26870 [Jannaschia sp. AI_62]
MTGYAALDRPGRRWELRSVNARGLDVRLKLPEAVPGLEPLAREMLTSQVARGNVTLTLRINSAGGGVPQLNAGSLPAALDAVAEVQATAEARGLALGPVSATDILALRGLWEVGETAPDLTPETCRSDLSELLTAFDADRAREGGALARVLGEHVDEIERLTRAATDLAPERSAHLSAALTAALDRIAAADVDQARLAQEIAMLAVKGDVTEELDRLGVHVSAARDLLTAEGPVGRRLDFLTQEFNREANTLCSKAQMSALTAIGMDLKTVIDRLREQVQNVE